MEKQKLYFVAINKYSFRPGKAAEIIGVAMFTPPNLAPRPCFHIRFEDGKEDWATISDTKNYRLISETDVKAGNIPSIDYDLTILS